MSSAALLVHSLMSLVDKLGYSGIFGIIALEYACFPIPSEVVLPFVGMGVIQTNLSFLSAFLVSIAAGLAGSWACYLIGQYGGVRVLTWLSRHSRHAKKATATFNIWFNKYGHWAVLLARVVPLTRTYISIFAGVSHMSFWEFMLYSSVGIAAWNLVLMSLGFYIGNNWGLIGSILNTYSQIVILFLGIILLLIVIKKYTGYKKVLQDK